MILSFLNKFLLLLLLLVVGIVSGQQNCGRRRRRRRPWRSLSCTEQSRFLQACLDLKRSGRWDELAINHFESDAWAHDVPEFLPWHRWFLWIAEQELQRVSGNCDVTIPYWDWERQGGLESALRSDGFGSDTTSAGNREGCVQDGWFTLENGWLTAENNRCLEREFDADELLDVSSELEILNRITNHRNYNDFRVELEGSPHAGPHVYIGGHMRSMWSADDPLFLLHHANIDRIYTLWQNYRGHPNVDVRNMGFDHYDASLNSRLRFEYTNEIDWFTGTNGRSPPTIRQLMKINGNDAIMNYVYEDDQLALMLQSTINSDLDPTWNNPGRVSTQPQCAQGRISTSGGTPTEEDTVAPTWRPTTAPTTEEGGDDDDDGTWSPTWAPTVQPTDNDDDDDDDGSTWAPTWSPTRGNDDVDDDGTWSPTWSPTHDEDDDDRRYLMMAMMMEEDTTTAAPLKSQSELESKSGLEKEDGTIISKQDQNDEHHHPRHLRFGSLSKEDSIQDIDPTMEDYDDNLVTGFTTTAASSSPPRKQRDAVDTHHHDFLLAQSKNNTAPPEGAAAAAVDDDPLFGELQNRWYELLEQYTSKHPDLIFEALAREDCQIREEKAGHPLLSAGTSDWIASHQFAVPANHSQTFHCHSTLQV